MNGTLVSFVEREDVFVEWIERAFRQKMAHEKADGLKTCWLRGIREREEIAEIAKKREGEARLLQGNGGGEGEYEWSG